MATPQPRPIAPPAPRRVGSAPMGLLAIVSGGVVGAVAVALYLQMLAPIGRLSG